MMDLAAMNPHPLDSEFKFLRVSVPEACPHVVVVSLDRPKKRNAMNSQMWREIGSLFSRLGRLGDGCRCVVLTGSGKAFSAGIDVSDSSFFPEPGGESDIAHRGLAFFPKILEMQKCFTAIEECPVPVIAAIHGNCIGAGVDISCCCDIRLCAPRTIFSVREVKLGLAADVGTLQRFPKVTGNDSRVRELCLTGELFDENEALRIGFVSRVSSDLLSDALKLSNQIASNSPVAVTGTKRSLVYSRDHTVVEGLEHIASHNAMALMTDDLVTAFASAASKSPATFSNLSAFSRL
jgi:delta(3,5)-delta(2,4)-dienoyl-CoA isomerase